MSNYKYLVIAGLAVMIIIIGYLYQHNKRQPVIVNSVVNKGLKIGSVLPLSGDFAFFGEEINQGVEIALDEARADGWQVEYVSEDDHSEAKGSTNAANKLTVIDRVDAVLTAVVQEVKPMAPVFNQAKVPLLVTWDSNEYIKSAGPNIFSIGFSTEAAGEKMANYAYGNLGLRKVAVVAALDEWSGIISSAFAKKFTALGGTVAVREQAQPNQKEFRTLLSKIKASGADGIYFPLLPTTMTPFLVQAQQLGVKSVMMSGDSFSQDEAASAGAAAEGVYFTNLFADDTKALIEKYKAKFGIEPADPIFVSFGYDAMKTLLAAKEIAQEKQIDLREALTQVDIQGTDQRIRMGGGQYSEKFERLYKVEDGKFVEVER